MRRSFSPPDPPPQLAGANHRGPRSLASRILARLERGAAGAESRLHDGRLVMSFLRGRLDHRPRYTDVFVVTYPRSGTTWVQYLLRELSGDGSMDFEHLTDVSPWFERSLAIGAARAADFESLPDPRIFKSHLTPRWLPAVGRTIYIERDVRDVAISYFHFYRSHLGFTGDLDAFFDRFISGRLQYGSWFHHVGAWSHRRGRPDVLWLTYEALLRDLPAVADRLVAFLGWDVDDRTRRRALERTRFDFMKRHEEKFDHVTAVLKERGLLRSAFLRQGRTGEGRLGLRPDQRERLRREAARPLPRWHMEGDLASFLH